MRDLLLKEVYCNFRVRLNPKLIKTSILSNTDGGENPPKLNIIDGCPSLLEKPRIQPPSAFLTQPPQEATSPLLQTNASTLHLIIS
ncbi:Transcription regulator protein BACH1 [Sesbania bispinosa]|nr:Transcription regulator protein BACH1 [Sesbania bispinosa]